MAFIANSTCAYSPYCVDLTSDIRQCALALWYGNGVEGCLVFAVFLIQLSIVVVDVVVVVRLVVVASLVTVVMYKLLFMRLMPARQCTFKNVPLAVHESNDAPRLAPTMATPHRSKKKRSRLLERILVATLVVMSRSIPSNEYILLSCMHVHSCYHSRSLACLYASTLSLSLSLTLLL
jgi:hypothetical protein